jgi:predicted anti-sigma-YlaC factor YlaD
MNQVSCNSVCLAAMAVSDGEKPSIPLADIELHLGQCARCRSEVEQLKSLMDLLNAQRRRERTESVWDKIAGNLNQRNEARKTSDHWPWLLLLGLLLAVFRLAVAFSDWESGLWLKLAPALLAIAVFGLLRENPFKVNPELQFHNSLRGHL